MKTKQFLLLILCISVLMIFFGTLQTTAQPPALPADPSQAPIDGGLGLLAAAGGVYALKKLRDRSLENDTNREV
ncbi:MAG: hypothetical protein AAFW89_09110 [Bacteroidota bacterium]